MGMKLAERHVRDQTLFYMQQSVDKLSQNAAISITKSPELKSFLLFLVQHEPKRMDSILKTASKKALESLSAIKEQKIAAEKRAAASDFDLSKPNKKPKLAATVSGTASCLRDPKLAEHFPFAPPPYTCRPSAEDSSSESEIDDGVELATPDPDGSLAQDKTHAGEPTDDEQDQEEDDNDDDDGGDDDDNDDDDDDGGRIHRGVHRADLHKTTSTEEHLHHLNHPANEQDNDIQENSSGNANLEISPAETSYQIERGLTNGDFKVISKLRTNLPILCKPEADTIFSLCQKLDFIPLRFKLVHYHQNRRAEIGTDKKLDRLPAWCDLTRPDEIFDDICVTSPHTHAAKIRRAFRQMQLFDSINKEAQEKVADGVGVKVEKLYIYHLEVLAKRKAGNVSPDEKKYKIQNYKDEYHGGGKWIDVCNLFGGKAVVLVFVAAEIGSQLIARKLTKEQRLALAELAPYLRNVKKMVSTLGPDSLEEYCRYGHLSAAKVKELEELEGGIDGDEAEMEENDD